MNRMFRASLLLVVPLALAACGFHLRQSASLPPALQHLHLTVQGHGNLERNLSRALEDAGVTLEDDSGPGVAELRIPVARFSTDIVSVTGYARVNEYAVRYEVRLEADDPQGQVLVPPQRIDMSREYSYDASQPIGNETQVEEIKRSLDDDMVQAILFRLEAAGRHRLARPAGASSAG